MEDAINEITRQAGTITNQQAQIDNLTSQVQRMMAALGAQQSAPSSPAAPAAPGMSSRGFESIMDPKMLQKMKSFDGTRASWRSWEFHWKAYLIAHDGRYRGWFADIEAYKEDVKNTDLNENMLHLSNQMYFMLAMAMPDDSIGELILRNCVEGEGATAWKQLLREYSPTEPGDVVSQFRRVPQSSRPAATSQLRSASSMRP
jgi:hypothetical protein